MLNALHYVLAVRSDVQRARIPLQDFNYCHQLSTLICLAPSFQSLHQVTAVFNRVENTIPCTPESGILIMAAGAIRVNYHVAVLDQFFTPTF
eukprot:8665133-Karenia_brevis.AAC.1